MDLQHDVFRQRREAGQRQPVPAAQLHEEAPAGAVGERPADPRAPRLRVVQAAGEQGRHGGCVQVLPIRSAQSAVRREVHEERDASRHHPQHQHGGFRVLAVRQLRRGVPAGLSGRARIAGMLPEVARRWLGAVGPEAGMEEGAVCDQAKTADEVLGFPLIGVHELLEESRHCGFAVTGWM